MSEEKVQCCDCEGSGKRFGVFPVYSESHSGERKPIIEMQCNRCHGTGLMPEFHLRWIESGRRLRNERLARQMALRSEAARRDMKPSELSCMEQGLVEPVFDTPEQ